MFDEVKVIECKSSKHGKHTNIASRLLRSAASENGVARMDSCLKRKRKRQDRKRGKGIASAVCMKEPLTSVLMTFWMTG